MTRTWPADPPDHDPTPGWGHSLGDGAAGIALLHAEYAHAGLAGWDRAHRWAAAMTRNPVTAHPSSASLYRGAPAVAYALHASGHPGYASALAVLDHHVIAVAGDRVRQAHERIDRRQLPALREFDLIRGLTGIGVYLRHRHGDSEPLREVLACLVRLTEPVTVDGYTLPGWWCTTGPGDTVSPQWPGGHGNLGMAHGISGPLALLSATARRGITVPGQAGAMGRICAWLDQWRTGTGTRTWWPGMVSLSEQRGRGVRQAGPQRPSWCYGTPGIARAQQLAALALTDPKRQRIAEQALAGCVTDEEQLSQLSDASLCHGWAGLLQATWRAAADAGGREALAAAVPHLRERLAQYLRHHRPVGGGLLEGMAGVLLAQHTTPTDTGPATRWDACLLLDG